MLARLRSWFRAVFWRSRLEGEMDAELRWHFDQYVEHLMEEGLSREEARRRARLELGDIEVQKDKCRDSVGLRFLDEMVDDVRFAVRSLRKQRLLAANVVITLTLGIGISAGVFTFVDYIALRPPVEKDRRSFLEIYPLFAVDATHPVNLSQATVEDYFAFRDKSRCLREVAAWGEFDLNSDSNDLATIRALLVSSNFFSLYDLGKAKLGRLLQPDDYLKLSPVVVLSEDSWRDRFAADPSIIGKNIHLNGQLVTVVGVAAPVTEVDFSTVEAWLPYTLTTYLGLGDQWVQSGVARWLDLAARLKPGFSRADAAAELGVIVRQQDKLHPGRRSSVIVTDGSMIQMPGDNRIVPLIALLTLLLALVLLISCANVTTLLLSRADARQHEVGVRLALGASRMRLIRMLVTETVLLGSVAGAASLYYTYRFPVLLGQWLNKSRMFVSIDPDWRVFAYLAVTTLMAGTLAGLAPALESLRVDLLSSLKGQRRFLTRRMTRWGLRHFLVTAQVAMSLVLLVGCGLFVGAHQHVLNADPGFEIRQVIITNIVASLAGTPESRTNFRDSVTRRIETTPGVRSAALASSLIPGLGGDEIEILPAGQSAYSVFSNQVTANYFATMGIPILRGRALERDDVPCGTNAGVCPVVVSQEFARQFLNGSDELGKTLRTSDGRVLEIVGVAGNVSSELYAHVYRPVVYRTWSLSRSPSQLFLLVRVNGDAERMSTTINTILRGAYPGSKVEARSVLSIIKQMAEVFWRLEVLMEILGGIAILLTVIGIYGVVSFAVSKRTKEIGIRVALGAMKKDIYAIVIQSSLRPIWLGLLIGVPVALGGVRVMRQALRPVQAVFAYNDPFTYAAPVCLLLVVSVLAMLGPARRAAACDPSKTLRDE
jgi:predicted permease